MKRRSTAVFLLIFVYLLGSTYAAEGPGGPSGSTGGGGDGNSERKSGGKKIVKLDLEDLIGNFEKWKREEPKDFEYMQKLLHIPFVPPKDYITPTVLIYYPSDKTEISRNEELTINASVGNKNPIEVRSDIYLWLEAKGPGEDNFTRVGSQRVVLANEYDETTNSSMREWSGITPFSDSKEIGNVTFRIWFNDMHSTYHTDSMYGEPYHSKEFHSELNLDLINSPPKIDEASMNVSPDPAKWNGPIKYVARFDDPDGDMINVTLHVFDDQGNGHRNATQIVRPGTNVTFIASEYAFFGEGDAGNNFTYSYSYNDGLDGNETNVTSGPTILPSPKIWVADPDVTPKTGYWWDDYRFSLRVKNPEINEVQIDLYTITPNGGEKLQDTRAIGISEEYEMVTFNLCPFKVSDAGQNFGYRFGYSEADQNSGNAIGVPNGGEIDPKIVRYQIYSGTMIMNILAVLLAALVGGVLIERRLYR